MKKKVK